MGTIRFTGSESGGRYHVCVDSGSNDDSKESCAYGADERAAFVNAVRKYSKKMLRSDFHGYRRKKRRR